jgi:hypothetical protein
MMEEEFERAKREFDRMKDAWLARESVTGMDIGFKMEGGQQTTRLAIRVYVREKLPLDQVPPRERFPEEVGGVPVDVIEGTFTAR